MILQKETPIGPDDTLGSVYFDPLFPMGVAALVEAADLIAAGRVQATPQDHSSASYEGWCRSAEAKINWHTHVDLLYDLIRGCDPPGIDPEAPTARPNQTAALPASPTRERRCRL
jgi:methionyl-tRNA formyltransferase